jgi:hypothetical protein
MASVDGGGSSMPDAEVSAMIAAINRSCVVQIYVTGVHAQRMQASWRSASDRARIALGWLRGERYLTPGRWRKLMLDGVHTLALQRRDALTAQRGLLEQTYVQYPLHMQPGSTIDVWGLPWNDRPLILRRTAEALAPLGVDLVVKPNPNPRHEVNTEQHAVDDSLSNVRRAAHALPIGATFEPAQAVLSVAGTVLIGGVFAGKPSFSLGYYALAR